MKSPKRRTTELSLAEYVALSMLFVLHWLIVLGFSTYALWGRPQWDKAYLALFALMILAWTFCKNCPISMVEKKLLYEYPDSLPSYFNPSLQFYQNTTMVSFLFMATINILYIATNAFVMYRMRIKYPVLLVYCMVIGFVLADARWHEYNNIARHSSS
jgi:hypothetical protein